MDPKPTEKQLARNYYLMSTLTPQQICDLLDINRKTFHSWMKAGQWQRIKYVEKNAPGLLCEQYTNQLGYLNEDIKHRERRYPTKEEADIMRKVSMTYKTIKGNRKPVEDNIELLTDFSHELRLKDKKLVADFIQPMDDYITKRFNECSGLDDPWKTYLQEMSEDREYEEWHSTQPQQPPAPPVERACPAFSAGAGVRPTPVFPKNTPITDTTVTARNEAAQLPGCHPELAEGAEFQIPNSNQKFVILSPAEGANSTEKSRVTNRASGRATHTPSTTPKPLPKAQITENKNTGLPTKKIQNVDKSRPFGMAKSKPLCVNNSETKNSECNPNSNQKDPVILPVPLIAGSPDEGTDSNKIESISTYYASLPPTQRPSPFREGNIIWVNDIDDVNDDERKMGDSVRRYSDINGDNRSSQRAYDMRIQIETKDKEEKEKAAAIRNAEMSKLMNKEIYNKRRDILKVMTNDIYEKVTISGKEVNKMWFQYNGSQMELPENQRRLLTEAEFLHQHATEATLKYMRRTG